MDPKIASRHSPFRPGHRPAVLAVLLASTALGVTLPVHAQVLPQGGQVAAGNVSIATPNLTHMQINQTSSSAIINWQGFSIGAAAQVNIHQPSASSTQLDRVTGDTPSTIAGSLNANGQVYLVNPNGISISKSGTVSAGSGFVASTLNINDRDFLSGRRSFSGSGASAQVSNAGTINVGPGGYAALLGGSVDNAGRIAVPLGKVGLGSGELATLDLSGDGFLQVALPTKATGSGALIRQSGHISATGGRVVLSAAQARAAVREAINMTGVIEARSISGHSGAIVLGGGDGAVKVSGRLDVSTHQNAAYRRAYRKALAKALAHARWRVAKALKAKAMAAKPRGGAITLTGRMLQLTGAKLDASGTAGGGTIKIGGDFQGRGSLAHAARVTIDAATTIKANAIKSGIGGNVAIWSDANTAFAGSITARGGTQGGNGGQVEVSSHGVLDYTGLTDLLAPKGMTGTLLLDPFNVTISAGAATPANVNDSVLNAAILDQSLAKANVTVTTGAAGSPGSQAGNITVDAPLAWASGSTLTLNADSAIAINANLAISGAGGLALYDNGSLSFAQGASVNFGAVNNGGTFARNGHAYHLVYTMPQLAAINGGTGYDALATGMDATSSPYAGAVVGTYNGNFEGLGNTVSNLTIAANTSNVGLFGALNGGASIRDVGLVGGSVAGLSSVGELVGYNGGSILQSYATGAVSGTGADIGGLVGFNNFGASIAQSYSTGTVTGPGSHMGGLLGFNNSGATVSQSFASGAVSSGGSDSGGLVGFNNANATIIQSHATGNVRNGGTHGGGLVGYNNTGGIISNTYASGMVSVAGSDAGGLVGFNNGGTISLSHASGSVSSGTSDSGGLIGFNNTGSVITQSSASGVVSAAGSDAGGLVGFNNGGALFQTSATGNVSAQDFNSGGLVGFNNSYGTITQSTASGAVSSGLSDAGGLVGFNASNGSILQTYATGAVTGAGGDVGGLVGFNNTGGAIRQSYATGLVSGAGASQSTGGLIGYDNATSTSAAYWDTATSGTSTSSGGIGQTTPALQGILPAGFDPTVWATGPGLYPYLKSFFPNGVQAVSGMAFNQSGAGAQALSGAKVDVRVDGQMFGSAFTGANGYYYAMAPAGAIQAAGSGVIATTAGTINGAAFQQNATGTTGNLDIYGNTLTGQYTATSLSAGMSAQANAIGNNPLTIQLVSGLANQVLYFSPNAVTIDQSINTSGNVRISTPGALTIASGVRIAGSDPVLAAGGAFINDAGTNALVANNGGRWLVYSANATGDNFGAPGNRLDSGNQAVWNVAAGGPVTATGNRYAFAQASTLTFTSTSVAAKTYGTALDVSGNYTVSGLQPGVTGAYLADSLATVTVGAPSLTSQGAAATANVAASPYAMNIGLGSLAATTGYGFAFNSNGLLNVTARVVTVAADPQSRPFGTTNPSLTYQVTAGNLVNGDVFSGAITTSANLTSSVGSYPITQGTLALSQNYALDFMGATFTVTPALLPPSGATPASPPAFTPAPDTNFLQVANQGPGNDPQFFDPRLNAPGYRSRGQSDN